MFFAVTIVGCSDEDNEVVGDNVSADAFTYTLDNETMAVTTITAKKSEDLFAVSGRSSDGRIIEVHFNKYGNLKEVNTYSVTDTLAPVKTNYHYYKANFFDFELVSLDEETKKVRVTFSGKVYEDEYDLTSEFSVVDGSFTVTYTDVNPTVAGINVSAKINGNRWYATETADQAGGTVAGENITLYASNDSAYSLTTILNHDTTEVGTYDFTTSSATNKVVLSIYETATNQNITFPTSSGTLKITEKTVGTEYTTISGTFSLTVFNPYTQANMPVTDGKFKRVYLNY